MKALPINEILHRLDELRTVSVLGQRAMPFFEEVLGFLREVVPILDEVDSSIRVSTTKMMPTAASRLASVNQATELATTEIMDLVDETYAKVKQTKEKIDLSKTYLDAMHAVDGQLEKMLESHLGETVLLGDVKALLNKQASLRTTMSETLNAKSLTLDEIRNNMNNIMISLQVQDITSQQIASVSHLIESVRSRLAKFEGQLGSGSLENFLDASPPTNVAFDGHASYDHSGTKQALAEEVMADFEPQVPQEAPLPPAGDPNISASTDEIDTLFNGEACPATRSDEPASADDISAMFGDGVTSPLDANETDSADNIEVTFGGGTSGQPAGGETASTDDINAIFGTCVSERQPSPDRAPTSGDDALGNSASQAQTDKLFDSGEGKTSPRYEADDFYQKDL